MRRIFASIITIGAIVAVAATSCKKDDTICYNNVTMGNIDGETIISDQGNTFDIVKTPYEINLSDYKYGRVILACDVLTQTAEKRYDIRLNGIESVLTKPAVKASTITDMELVVEDAIVIRDMWFGGGYINLLIEFAHKEGSDKAHFINLIHDDTLVNEKYAFYLRHNAYGEVPKEGEVFRSSLGYVSFPISQIIEEDEAEISITWNSHRMTNVGYDLYETEILTRKGTWKRADFEHKPTSVKASASFRVR